MEIAEGLLFALLWASATVATKLARHSADLFLLSLIRFSTVSILLLIYLYVIKKKQSLVPTGPEFKRLFILGLLNVTIYISGYLIAIKTVSAGLISLVTATNPLLLILFSSIAFRRKLLIREKIGILVSLSGLVLAAIPNLRESHATLSGLVALVLGITSLSAGSIYYSKSRFRLSRMTVNTWQISFGGLLFIPIVCFNPAACYIRPDLNFLLTLSWLVLPVTIIAYALWLNLLQKDPVKASLWLFLTPALGYMMAVIFLREPVTGYGILGSGMVVTGLLYSRKRGQKERPD